VDAAAAAVPSSGSQEASEESLTESSQVNAATSTNATPASGRVIASPIAKRIAAEKGIDLKTVSGTGPNNRVVKADVLAAQPAASAPVAQGSVGIVHA
jgi:pyruvate dehydrogenase E2 component (dihydrolipoamide acetyltransferase)